MKALQKLLCLTSCSDSSKHVSLCQLVFNSWPSPSASLVQYVWPRDLDNNNTCLCLHLIIQAFLVKAIIEFNTTEEDVSAYYGLALVVAYFVCEGLKCLCFVTQWLINYQTCMENILNSYYSYVVWENICIACSVATAWSSFRSRLQKATESSKFEGQDSWSCKLLGVQQN